MIRIRQLKLQIENDTLDNLYKESSNKLHINKNNIEELIIIKKSLDARKKESLLYVYEVDIKIKDELTILKKISSKDIFIAPEEKYIFPKTGAKEEIIIVGAGPAGLFSAYLLAENNYHPIVIEQGEKIEDRVKRVEEFFKTSKLNTKSNIQFGEGGAGTFSDGKLNTLVKDKNFRGKKVFEIFVENGAPKEIMYKNKPHIGTDILRRVIINMRNKIIELGGEFIYNAKVTDIEISNNKLRSIKINNDKSYPCKNLILAIGNSARDTFQMLYDKGLEMTSKPFAVGLRVIHPQLMINESQYGKKYAKKLPPASYKLTYTTKEKRGVYSFCMCPGGYVVNASSEEEKLVVNGMSNHKRDTINANSAIVVTVFPKDFGPNPLDGIKYQQRLESLAYKEGTGKIPLQLYKDFLLDKKTNELGEVIPITKGDYSFANLNKILPKYITDSIKEAMPYFSTKIKGFDREDTLLLGVESRTSSPVRILRDDNCLSNIEGIYPAGEGAGYSGGITSSAMDGIKVAENIAKKVV